jgi:hypothetical protein
MKGINASVFNSHSRTYYIMCDNDMPQCGFNNVEGADVAFLETVLPAKLLPTPHDNEAVVLAWETTNLP